MKGLLIGLVVAFVGFCVGWLIREFKEMKQTRLNSYRNYTNSNKNLKKEKSKND